MTTPILAQISSTAISLPATIERAREYADAAHATNTQRGYASDLRGFEVWCARRALRPLPAEPQTVVLYVSDLAGYAKIATIRRHLAAIAHAHRERGLESPVGHEIVRRVVRGIARTNGVTQTKKAAVTLDVLRAMLLAVRGNDLKAKRDRAIILLGFAGALRRSEIAALDVADPVFSKSGLLLTIRRSKTDQTGEGQEIAVPFVANEALCAVTAVRAWLDAAKISEGALFRTFSLNRSFTDLRIGGRDVANLIKTLARRAHVDGDFSGHSLRAGFATSAAQAKVPLDAIARTTRHKSLAILSGYIRHANAFEGVALASIVA